MHFYIHHKGDSSVWIYPKVLTRELESRSNFMQIILCKTQATLLKCHSLNLFNYLSSLNIFGVPLNSDTSVSLLSAFECTQKLAQMLLIARKSTISLRANELLFLHYDVPSKLRLVDLCTVMFCSANIQFSRSALFLLKRVERTSFM